MDQSSFSAPHGLIAEYHVLHRLLLPRHPPNALFALDLIQKEQNRREAFCFPPRCYDTHHCVPRFPVRSHTFPIPHHQHETLVSVLDLNKTACGLEAQVTLTRGPAVLMFLSLHDVKTVMPLGTNSASVRTAKRVTRALRSERHWISGKPRSRHGGSRWTRTIDLTLIRRTL